MTLGDATAQENSDAARDTIYALASGRGRSAIAVIRISGPAVRETLVAIAGRVPPQRIATRILLHDPDSGEPLDDALVLYFQGPKSFSGEDTAELHLHGGPSVVAGVIDALSKRRGLRAADAGEFTRRAFANGKMDLTEIEGLADLIEAETRAQRLQALRQSSGALGELYESWRSDLINALALVEASLDFSDEADVPALIEREALPVASKLEGEIAKHLDDARRGERLRQGFCVVLAGPPNAGKSSLLNALAARDVAIVSDEPGTTRDALEVHLDLDGWPVTLIDTAGLREAAGAVETEGMLRALERARTADLVLWMIDASEPQWDLPDNIVSSGVPAWRLLNKSDLAEGMTSYPEDVQAISAKTGEGLDALTARLSHTQGEGFESAGHPVITRARHREELTRAREALDRFLSGDAADLELRAEDLRMAAHALGRITGRVDVEDILDRIFSGFCIGK